jgi:pyrimidine-nucleoside phosphorylase
MYQLIERKKQAKELTSDEIKWMIGQYTKKLIPDYQMSAMLMAIYFNGMSTSETAALTDSMLFSGKTLKFKGSNVVDKHSTGGIGDKASFVLGPIAAACGVKVPMMAGRGLGHTGGTVDKIEAIKGFKTNLTLKQFQNQLNKHGIVLIGQTSEVAPADKTIYALRDVTATIDSIPLITASIMSKKLAEGANGIVMDIKVGSGAFMKDLKNAQKLANSILKTAKRFNKKAVALITDMNQPLGNTVGHSLELIESIETLKGNGPKDLTEISIELAANMIYLASPKMKLAKAKMLAEESIKNGTALAKFKELIKIQGGDASVIENYAKLPMAKEKSTVKAVANGYIAKFNNAQIGLLCTELGGGRKQKTDKIDFGVGFEFHKKVGDSVKKGEPILTIYHHKKQVKIVKEIITKMNKEVITLSKNKTKKLKTIYKRIE